MTSTMVTVPFPSQSPGQTAAARPVVNSTTPQSDATIMRPPRATPGGVPKALDPHQLTIGKRAIYCKGGRAWATGQRRGRTLRARHAAPAAPMARVSLHAGRRGLARVVRIVLGAMIAWDVVRYFQTGWISEYYILPKWYFPYLYLEWVRPWPGQWMYAHFAAMLVVALLVAVGCTTAP
jgi:hypothetical protein